MRDVLAGINASHFDGYHDWVAVGFALKNSGYPCSLWDEASNRVPGKYEAGACAAKWALLKQGSVAKPLTVASLWQMLKDENAELFAELQMRGVTRRTRDVPRRTRGGTLAASLRVAASQSG